LAVRHGGEEHWPADRLEAGVVRASGLSVPREIIAVAVRWYLCHGLSYRDVEELLAERGIDATVDLLAEQGFVALSVEAIAARAGVAKTTIYRRWPNKDMLVMDAVGCMHAPLAEPPGESVREDLLFLMNRKRDGWFKGRFGRLMGRLAADGIERPDLCRECKARFVAPRRALMHRIMERGIAEGSIRPDADPEWVI